MTAVWGSTFVVVKDAVERIPVTDFLTWRFALAALAMLLIRPRAVATLGPGGRRAGVLLGLALGIGYLLQTIGLETTDAAVSGFITGMFVVLTPLGAAVLLKKTPDRIAWLAVGLATVGLGFLSLRGLAVGGGELLTLGCAACFALHIVGLGRWASAYDVYGLAVVQLLTVAALCAVGAVPGGLTVPPDGSVWAALALTALAATAVAFVVQTWAQAHLAPTRAAVIMTMEPVFAGLFAVVAGGERLGPRTLVGAAMVLTAMVLTELGPRRGSEGEVERLEV
ncbi:MAG: DMT family transporter [Frankiaceae bacterium]|nr:DMT family transporter [Frankiaceae bacterium]